MAEVIRSVKGTVDYYPEKMALRSWLFSKMRLVSESFGYQEYDAPFLERFELYAAKSGEELVEKQSYVFEDRGGERIALRPELTPSLARMVAAKQRQLQYPLRWWSFGPFWRYERPQKGRSREFFQWNIDLIGDDTSAADAELASIAATFLKSIGLQSAEVMILVNNRQLMQSEILALGIDEDQLKDVYRLIDRKDKLDHEKWLAYAASIDLSPAQIDGLVKITGDEDLWKKSNDLVDFFAAIEAMGMQEYIRFAPSVIRGLDYYTGTVFEAWDTAGEFRSIFGGGRYNNLVNAVGGEPLPAVGFAAGNMVLSLMLEKLGHIPDLAASPAPVYVTIFNSEGLPESLKVAQELRGAGINVSNHLKDEKLQKQFKQADRLGAKIVLVIGPDEIANEEVRVKDLTNGDQVQVKRSELVNKVQELLETKRSS